MWKRNVERKEYEKKEKSCGIFQTSSDFRFKRFKFNFVFFFESCFLYSALYFSLIFYLLFAYNVYNGICFRKCVFGPLLTLFFVSSCLSREHIVLDCNLRGVNFVHNENVRVFVVVVLVIVLFVLLYGLIVLRCIFVVSD